MGSSAVPFRGLDRWLPADVGAAPELRPRARALVAISLGSVGWFLTVAGLLFAVGRPVAGVVLGALVAAPLLILRQLHRTADLPRAATTLAAVVLVASGVGAAGGGLSSPLVGAAVLAGALLTAFGRVRAVGAAVLVPLAASGVAVRQGAAFWPAGLEATAHLVTLTFVVAFTTILLAAERAARSAAKSWGFREGAGDEALDRPSPDSPGDRFGYPTERHRWELEGARFLLEHAPVALFTLDADGRLGRLRNPLARPLVGEDSLSSRGARRGELGELQDWLERSGTPKDADLAREAMLAWRAGQAPEAIRRGLPSELTSPRGGRVRLDWVPAFASDGRLQRFVCAARETSGEGEAAVPRPRTGPVSGAVVAVGALVDVLEPCLTDANALLHVDEDANVPVSGSIAETIRAAVGALLANAMQAGESVDRRQSLGKPDVIGVELRAQRRGRVLVLSVSDDGPGINWAEVERRASQLGLPIGSGPERLRALASPGLSTRGQGGTGLAQAAAGAHLLGGRLSLAASVDGEGAVFELVFPLPLPDRLRVGGASHPPRSSAGL
ncbi:MAG: ATP-binding protein [Myxococcota bacterium]